MFGLYSKHDMSRKIAASKYIYVVFITPSALHWSRDLPIKFDKETFAMDILYKKFNDEYHHLVPTIETLLWIVKRELICHLLFRSFFNRVSLQSGIKAISTFIFKKYKLQGSFKAKVINTYCVCWLYQNPKLGR